MPIVQMPDGTQVSFPDTMSETSIRGLIAQKFPKEVGEAGAAKPMSERGTTGHYAFDGRNIPGYNQATGEVSPGYAEDVLKSGASALPRGAADLVGLPGSIADAMNAGGQWALRKGYQAATGNEPQPGTFFGGPKPEYNQQNPLSGSRLRSGLSTVSGGGTDYQPKTVPGEYTRTLGEFAPSAVAFGGASIPALMGNLVAPAFTSETAGQITKGTALEPYARVVGALAGGVAGNALTKPSAAQLPSAAEIKASAGYADLKEPLKAAQIDQPTYQGIIKNLWAEANDFGLTTKLKGEVSGTLTDFVKRAKSGGASLYDLEVLRRSLRNIGGDKLDDAAKALSSKLIDKLDQTVEGISSSAIATAGEAGAPTLDALKQARQTWQTGVKSGLVEQAMEKAKNVASGYENGLRVEFRKLLTNPKYASTFSDTERQAIEGVVQGSFKSNALRWLGGFGIPIDNGRNFLGSVIGGGAGASLGSALGGALGVGSTLGAGIGGPALMGAGTLAKLASNAATRDSSALAEALVKAGPDASRLFSEAMAQATVAGREALLRAALQSQSAAQVPPTKVPMKVQR